jgi:predicted RNase H-like HicB family nuclease
MKKYLIVIEETATGYSAYSPAVPGCVEAGAIHAEIETNVTEAIAFHPHGLRQDGEPVPEPRAYSAYVELPRMTSRLDY